MGRFREKWLCAGVAAMLLISNMAVLAGETAMPGSMDVSKPVYGEYAADEELPSDEQVAMEELPTDEHVSNEKMSSGEHDAAGMPSDEYDVSQDISSGDYDNVEKMYGTEEIDISDMVYQAGGWGTPVEEWAEYALTAREQLKEEILAAIQRDETELAVLSYGLEIEDMDEVRILFAEVLNEHPDLFYINPYLGYSYYGNDVFWIYWKYTVSSLEERQIFADRMQEAISCVKEGMTDVEKALALHDYLALNCAYAYKEYLEDTLDTVEHVYDSYGALVNGKAVCQGYAEAYRLLLSTVGIQSDLCSSGEMNHAWNVVMIDGNWYHVDVTWDDPTWNREGQVFHSYFLLSDAEMGERGHYGWWTQTNCVSTEYDSEEYWWCDVRSLIIQEENRYYYIGCGSDIAGNQTFQLMEREGSITRVKYSQQAVWEVWEGNGYVYTGVFSRLSREGDYLYFNDKLNLYAMKLSEEAPQVIYSYEGGEGYIYGAMVYRDGTARLNISKEAYGETDAYTTVDLRAEAPYITIDYAQGTLSTTAAMQYSLDQGMTWSDCTDQMEMTDFGWDGRRPKEVAFRFPAIGGRFASEVTLFIIPVDPDMVSGSLAGSVGVSVRTDLLLLDSNGETVAEMYTTEETTEYLFEQLAAGTYILRSGREKHVTREYPVVIADGAVWQDVELWLRGDVNGDGEIDAKDKRILYNHIASGILTGYEFQVGDADGSGEIDARDKRMLYNHIAGTGLLW